MATQAQNQPKITHTFVTEDREDYDLFYETYYPGEISSEEEDNEEKFSDVEIEKPDFEGMRPLVQQYKKTIQQEVEDSFDEYIAPKKDIVEPQRLVVLRNYRETLKTLQDISHQISATSCGIEKNLERELHKDFTKLLTHQQMVTHRVRLLLKENYTQIEKLMKDLETSKEEVKNRPLF